MFKFKKTDQQKFRKVCADRDRKNHEHNEKLWPILNKNIIPAVAKYLQTEDNDRVSLTWTDIRYDNRRDSFHVSVGVLYHPGIKISTDQGGVIELVDGVVQHFSRLVNFGFPVSLVDASVETIVKFLVDLDTQQGRSVADSMIHIGGIKLGDFLNDNGLAGLDAHELKPLSQDKIRKLH